jgi:hypothetical protein
MRRLELLEWVPFGDGPDSFSELTHLPILTSAMRRIPPDARRAADPSMANSRTRRCVLHVPICPAPHFTTIFPSKVRGPQPPAPIFTWYS